MGRKTGLDSLERFGWRFGLGTMRALLQELGNPQLSARMAHVAGSNGKGSTCAFLASCLKQAGFRVGLYTSPHLSDIRERFRINGTWIDLPSFNRWSRRVLSACGQVQRRLGHSPTHFEALTALAFLWFREQKTDWVVLETGLGGRLDATNVIPTPDLALITPVGLEHQDILGKSLSKIAWEKAGILKAGGLAATFQKHREALSVIQRAAKARGTLLWSAGKEFHFTRTKKGFTWEGPGLSREFHLPRMAEYQAANAALAVAGLQLAQSKGVFLESPEMEAALQNSRWPGRMEEISGKPLIVIDGAHNPEAVLGLTRSLSARYPGRRWIVLNGFLADKDFQTCARLLAPFAAFSVSTEPANARAAKAESVFKAWEKAGVSGLAVSDWKKALWVARQKAGRTAGLLMTGSLYLLGDCREAILGLGGLKKI
ncbi:MAG: bifunctional folylpolyglutamate synthase/dihydrofolate synthase [bacterium]